MSRPTQDELQQLHAMFCASNGITDGDAVIADWNRRQPLAPWNCPPDQCAGPYCDLLIGYLTGSLKHLKESKS